MIIALEHHPMSAPRAHAATEFEDPQFNEDEHVNTRIEDGRVGLGANAVKLAIDDARRALDDGTRMYEQILDLEHENLVIAARERLAELSEDQKDIFNRFLNKNANSWVTARLDKNYTNTKKGMTSSQFKKTLQRKGSTDYVGKLLEVDKTGQYVIDTATFGNFLEWNNHELMKRQAELDTQSEGLKERFKTRFLRAIDDDWVPEWVRSRVDDRIDLSEIAVDDGFDTMVFDWAGNHVEASTGVREIVVEPDREDKLEKTLDHELCHALDGRVNDFPVIYSLFKSEEAGRALNEAVVEHLADALSKGNDINIIHPDSKERSGAVYTSERYLLYVLAECGEQPINIRTFIAAHFDDGSYRDEQGRTPLQTLRLEIDRAFPGKNVLGRLDEMETMEDIFEYAKTLDIKRQVEEQKQKRQANVKWLAGAAAVLIAGGSLARQIDFEELNKPTQLDGNAGLGEGQAIPGIDIGEMPNPSIQHVRPGVSGPDEYSLQAPEDHSILKVSLIPKGGSGIR